MYTLPALGLQPMDAMTIRNVCTCTLRLFVRCANAEMVKLLPSLYSNQQQTKFRRAFQAILCDIASFVSYLGWYWRSDVTDRSNRLKKLFSQVIVCRCRCTLCVCTRVLCDSFYSALLASKPKSRPGAPKHKAVVGSLFPQAVW